MSYKDFVLQTAVALIAFYMVFSMRSNRFQNSEAIQADSVELLLYESTDLAELVDLLHFEGIEFDEAEFIWAAGVLGRSQFLQGRYLIDGSLTYDGLLGKLARGEQDPKRIIVRAGQSYERFFNRVPTQFQFTGAELEAAMRDTAYITEELGLEPHLLFGRMIPNTYEMYWTITPYQFIERMLREFDRAMNSIQDLLDESTLTIDEVLTMASIIELEALYDSEKPRIAGLYWNRINQRWRLQADPTVSYALGERRRLTFADYRVRHPYNTYIINGLPPGPITNPAMSSIRAVLEPESHPYMFMVATPEGYHTFTRTYPEHRRESAKWTQWIREQERIRRTREREELLRRQLLQATI